MNDPEPFHKDEEVDKPAIVGARWWQDGLAEVDPIARRTALKTMLVAAGALASAGVGIALFTAGSKPPPAREGAEEEFRTDAQPAISMQRQYGWNFGATSERLVFDGTTTAPFDKSSLDSLATDLSPGRMAYLPFFVPSLLQSPTALRQTVPAGDPDTFTPLKDVLVPIFTPAMEAAYGRGRALASLFDRKRHEGAESIAVIVDLAGPEAVAFAAGATGAFDPVFLFDNWPHPRGVAASHLTLAACAYYQPLFARARQEVAKDAPPMFVLDRARLSAYSDDAKQFDNRYVARIPSADNFAKLGITHVLYVAPSDSDRELDDLNDDFVYAIRHGGDIRLVGASSFVIALPSADAGAPAADAGATRGPTYFYGDDQSTHEWFWNDYPWAKPYVAKGKPLPTEPSLARTGPHYVPEPRVTPFSSGAYMGAVGASRPPGFGTVAVVVAAATGVILGAKMSRSGSWTRSSSWGGG